MNGFDDFDTKVAAEEYYRGEGYDNDTIDEFVKIDESLMGGKYHGPSNEAGLTAREYWETRYEWEDEQARLRDAW
jgi:hypothetical protein